MEMIILIYERGSVREAAPPFQLKRK